MIFRFIMISDEVADFRRDFRLDADDSFLDLYKTIVRSIEYKEEERASFFLCDDDWERNEQISLVDMNTRSEMDSYTMEDTPLGDFLEDERQKLIFTFDYPHERMLYMELREITFGQNLDEPEVSKSSGDAPTQFTPMVEEPIVKKVVVPIATPNEDEDYEEEDSGDEDFYGDTEYNEDELDADEFDDADEDSFGEMESDISIDELDI